MALTKKFHWPYLGKMIATTLSVVILLYVLGVAVINSADPATLGYSRQFLFGGFFGLTVMLMILVIFMGFLTAHRVAGPHINLRQTCDQIAEGNLDARIKFRAEDKLDDVQEAFNNMLDSLQERVKQLEARLAEIDGCST